MRRRNTSERDERWCCNLALADFIMKGVWGSDKMLRRCDSVRSTTTVQISPKNKLFNDIYCQGLINYMIM